MPYMINDAIHMEGEGGQFLSLSVTPNGLLEIEVGSHPYVSIHHAVPMEVVHGWLMNIFLRAAFSPKRLAELADIDDPRLIGFIKELK